MNLETATKCRLLIAKRYEVTARLMLYAGMATIGLSWFLQNLWMAIIAAFVSMPCAWIFNLRCPVCSWLVYRIYGTADDKHAKDQLLAPLYSRHIWRQPPACTKCAQPFLTTENPSEAIF